MPKKKHVPLPESLRYLQPFANALAKLGPDGLNEDVDASRLQAALRKRIRNMDLEAAESQLDGDRELLAGWLEDKPDHPAHWMLGFILSPTLAFDLMQPAVPPLRGPGMLFEAPKGWKVKPVPFRLDLKAGKVIGSIMAIDESTFKHLQWQQEQAAKVRQPGIEATDEVSDVSFDQCTGKKYLYRQTAPAPWKQVDYVLHVPGGFVSIGLGTVTGAEFDESPLESKLHTLRFVAESGEG
jgi:hypothetical protein